MTASELGEKIDSSISDFYETHKKTPQRAYATPEIIAELRNQGRASEEDSKLSTSLFHKYPLTIMIQPIDSAPEKVKQQMKKGEWHLALCCDGIIKKVRHCHFYNPISIQSAREYHLVLHI